MWVALFGTHKLAHLVPPDGALTEVDLPNPAARPRRLVVDERGIVWYSDYARGYLGSYDPQTGRHAEWRTPTEHGAPYGIAIGPDGRVWFDEVASGSIVAFDRSTHAMESVKIPTVGSIVRNIAVDTARGRLWLAESGVERLGRIDVPAGR
jgi:virginiamycin B lyase